MLRCSNGRIEDEGRGEYVVPGLRSSRSGTNPAPIWSSESSSSVQPCPTGSTHLGPARTLDEHVAVRDRNRNFPTFRSRTWSTARPCLHARPPRTACTISALAPMIKCYVGSICQLHVFPPSGSYNGGGPKGGGSAGSPVHSRDILQPPRPLRTVDVASRAHSYYSPRPRTRT